MARSPFDLKLEELPKTLPLFPLPGALLLPRGKLPLTIFEPRYLAMTAEGLMRRRIIGMIQPVNAAAQGPLPPLYGTGCAGRINFFRETDEGRLVINLIGVCRFNIQKELAPHVGGFRIAHVDYAPWKLDLAAEPNNVMFDRSRLLLLLRPYFHLKNVSVNWKAVESASDSQLLTSVIMICPFDPAEKQALLESPTLESRAEAVIALLEMAVVEAHGHHRGARQ